MTADAVSAAADVAALAGLLADRTRAGVCLSLLDGRAWTAGELGRATGVSAATMSEHLDRLVRGGLLAEERQGRHRYVRLAGPAAAELVERLASATASAPVSGYRAVTSDRRLAFARTCYDHLAGALGVSVLDALESRGHVDRRDGVVMTSSGFDWLAGHGIDAEALRHAKRPIVRLCLDWTERRSHLAGAAGAAIASLTLERGWLERIPGGRALRLTDAGRRQFIGPLGVRMPGE